MRSIDEVTTETLDALQKSSTTEGVLVSTGIQGIDLSGIVALVPVNVPARNNTSAFPRVIAGEGSQTAVWRSLLNINAEQSDAAVGMDYAGSLVKIKEQDVFAPYKPLAKAGRVTLDAVAVARNFADALAIAELQTLNQLFIAQDVHIVNGQAWSLNSGTPGAPTLATATTGGSIKKSTKVEVAYAARSGYNYYYGGSTKASTGEHVETGSGTETNTVTASVTPVKGAVAYDWFVGVEGSKLYYYTTTTVASVTVTAVPTKAESLPSLQLLSTKAPEAEASKVTTDTSYSANWYNGVIASTLGDYGSTAVVTPGSGTSSGATYINAKGSKLTASGSSITLLDEVNDELWSNVQLSPTAYMVNSQQADEISKAILETNASVTFLPPTDADARTNLAGGGFIGRYINKAAGGVPVAIEVHPHVPPGTLIARTDRVPFPGSNIGSVFEVRCQYDTMRFDYAANLTSGVGGGPRYDFEVRSMETLVNRAPVAQAVVTNIA